MSQKFASPSEALGAAARVVYGLSRAQVEHDEMLRQQIQRQHAEQLNEVFRQVLAERSRPMRENAHFTRMPVILHAGRPSGGDDMGLMSVPLMQGSQVPMGYDEGMVRMASAVGHEFAHMYKDAGIGTGIKNLAGSAVSAFKNKVDGIAAGGVVRGALTPKQRPDGLLARAQAGFQNVVDRVGKAGSNAAQSVKNVNNRVGNALTAKG